MNRPLPYICLFVIVILAGSSCSKTTYYSGSSQTGVFYNQLALKSPMGGGGLGGFSPFKRRFRNGRQIVPTESFHTAGLTFLMGIPGVNTGEGLGRPGAYQYGYPGFGLHYTARINVAKWNNDGSVSIDFPIQMAITSGTDFVNYPNPNLPPKEKTNFSAEIPVTFNVNFGHQATKNSGGIFGGFVGAGYSFAYLPSGLTGTYNTTTNTTNYNLPIGHGPHGRAGIRLRAGTIGLQFYGSFMYNIYSPSHVAGVGLGITFGRW